MIRGYHQGMQSKATTVEAYLAELPADRRAAIEAVRAVIRKNLPKGYEEGMQYGMIGYYVPHSVYPAGYHCDPQQPVPFASLASQKNHMALYLMCVYSDPEQQAWFEEAWARTGKRLDMGKSCLRFKKVDNLSLDVIGTLIKRVPVKQFLQRYEAALNAGGKSPAKRSVKAAVKKTKSAPKRKTAETPRRATKKTTRDH